MTTTWIEEIVQTKGDLPGHPFRGNQWTGGAGGLSNDAASDLISRASSSQIYEGGREDILDKREGHLYRGYTFKDEDSVKEFLTSGSLGGQSSVYGKTVYFADDPSYATSHIRGEGFGVLVEVKNDGESFEQSGQFQVAKGDANFSGVTRIAVLKAQLDSSIWGAHSRAIMEVEQNKSPSRLTILHKALEITTQAVRLKQLLLKDQLRNAVVKAVHVKQYAETEAELTEAVAGLIKRQFKQASKSITESGSTKFDPRDWDSDLIDTCLPILMKHAGEAAAAQMLLMGVDIAPRKKVGKTEKASRATDWLLALGEEGEDLSPIWPEVFTLPSGAVVDLGFATEWPDWMKTEITKQMKETFEQPFWAGINDTTAKGIQAHVEKGLLEGLSIREIRQQMVGDGLDEYYHNRGINIARTESGSALNGARSAAMDRLAEEVPGLKVKRTWMSVLGTTTRDTHASLDGVPADRDGLWYLGGVRVPWPGHWNLPVGERACCQCTLVQSWGQSDETAEQLIEEYNQRLVEERSLRQMWIKHLTAKGDLPGHPFRGNQWSGGSTGGSETTEGKQSIFKDWIESPESDAAELGSGVIMSKSEVDGRSFMFISTPVRSNLAKLIVEDEGKSGTRYMFYDEKGSDKITNRGGAMKVMRRAVQEFAAHMKIKTPDFVHFSAAEPSRQKLYEFMTTRVGELFPGYIGVRLKDHSNTFAIVKDGIALAPNVEVLRKSSKSMDFLDDSFWDELLRSLKDYRKEKSPSFFAWLKHLAGQHNQADHARGGGSVLQSHISEMISHLETIFKGPGRAAAVNEVLSAAKFPEYLKGILMETPGIDEIKAVVDWSVRRGRIWEVA